MSDELDPGASHGVRTTPALTRRLVSFRDDVVVETGAELLVRTPWGVHVLGADAVVEDALSRLALGPVDPNNLPRRQGPAEDHDEVVSLLSRLGGSIVHSLGEADGGTPLLSVVPLAPDARFVPRPVRSGDRLRLSRHAQLLRAPGVLRLESPRAPFRVELMRKLGADVATLLVEVCTVAEVTAHLRAPCRCRCGRRRPPRRSGHRRRGLTRPRAAFRRRLPPSYGHRSGRQLTQQCGGDDVLLREDNPE